MAVAAAADMAAGAAVAVAAVENLPQWPFVPTATTWWHTNRRAATPLRPTSQRFRIGTNLTRPNDRDWGPRIVLT